MEETFSIYSLSMIISASNNCSRFCLLMLKLPRTLHINTFASFYSCFLELGRPHIFPYFWLFLQGRFSPWAFLIKHLDYLPDFVGVLLQSAECVRDSDSILFPFVPLVVSSSMWWVRDPEAGLQLGPVAWLLVINSIVWCLPRFLLFSSSFLLPSNFNTFQFISC